MRKRSNEREIPDLPIYFTVDVPGRGPHHFRIPRTSTIGRLTTLVFRGASFVLDLQNKAEDGITSVDQITPAHTLGGMLAENAVGNAIGVCWRHRDLDLDADRKLFERGEEGDMEYGDAVLEEMHEEGYTTPQIKAITDGLITVLIKAALPAEEAVTEQVGFTAARGTAIS